MAAASRGHSGPQVSVALTGILGAGKTALLHRFTRGAFVEHTEATVGIGFETKVEGDTRIVFHDTAGQERFHGCVESAARSAHVLLMVYAVDEPDDADRLMEWYVKRLRLKVRLSACVIVVGNKMDLLAEGEETDAARAKFEGLMEKVRAEFGDHEGTVDGFLTSAKDGTGVHELLDAIKAHGTAVWTGITAGTTNTVTTIDISEPVPRRRLLPCC